MIIQLWKVYGKSKYVEVSHSLKPTTRGWDVWAVVDIGLFTWGYRWFIEFASGSIENMMWLGIVSEIIWNNKKCMFTNPIL